VSPVTGFRSLAVAAALAAAAALPGAAAGAQVTTTPLGSCIPAAPSVAPKLERLTVSSPMSIAPDGTPRGQAGITLRNKADAYNGSWISVELTISDVATGKIVGDVFVDNVSCSRILIPLSLGWGVGHLAPLKLARGHLYAVRATGGYLEGYGGNNPAAYLTALLTAPIAFFTTY